MKIYTKTGDDGTTGLFGGTRVAKDNPRIEAYGTVDELNSQIGLIRAHTSQSDDIDGVLESIQNGLFVLGADLATPEHRERKAIAIPRVTSADVVCLEAAIDRFEEELPPLTTFILPGGSVPGAMLHVARCVARRAERLLASLHHLEPEIGLSPLQYLNRLSDLLFVLARVVNHRANVVEAPWSSPGRGEDREEREGVTEN